MIVQNSRLNKGDVVIFLEIFVKNSLHVVSTFYNFDN